jgi:4a-hydroxytetrahydrobiopterin dehydratase
MTTLSQLKCVACRGGESKLTDAEVAELQKELHGWELKEIDGILRLEKVFRRKNFIEALALANEVGVIAEEEDHHPLMIVEWGRVTIQWWTHVVKGLHKNDFIMAAKTDQLEAGYSKPV